jgi:hypothetical protein
VPFVDIFQSGSDHPKELGRFHHLQLLLNLLVQFLGLLAEVTFQWLLEWYCFDSASHFYHKENHSGNVAIILMLEHSKNRPLNSWN